MPTMTLRRLAIVRVVGSRRLSALNEVATKRAAWAPSASEFMNAVVASRDENVRMLAEGEAGDEVQALLDHGRCPGLPRVLFRRVVATDVACFDDRTPNSGRKRSR
jgi:hypothetical protein